MRAGPQFSVSRRVQDGDVSGGAVRQQPAIRRDQQRAKTPRSRADQARSAASPWSAPGKRVLATEIAGSSDASATQGWRNASSTHSCTSRVNVKRPLATSIAISHGMMADTKTVPSRGPLDRRHDYR